MDLAATADAIRRDVAVIIGPDPHPHVVIIDETRKDDELAPDRNAALLQKEPEWITRVEIEPLKRNAAPLRELQRHRKIQRGPFQDDRHERRLEIVPAEDDIAHVP